MQRFYTVWPLTVHSCGYFASMVVSISMNRAKLLKCLHCFHEWVHRGDSVPRRCPNSECRTVCWNRSKRTSKESLTVRMDAPELVYVPVEET